MDRPDAYVMLDGVPTGVQCHHAVMSEGRAFRWATLWVPGGRTLLFPADAILPDPVFSDETGQLKLWDCPLPRIRRR